MAVPLEIRHLVKYYDNLCAVDHVNLEVQEGEIFGLLGPNGAGKTSIISTIVTLEEPSSGTICVFGHDVTKDPRTVKMATGFMPQELIHHGYFSVEEVMMFHSGYYGLLNNRERVHYLLHRLGMWPHRHKRVKQLSGGMKRRLLIAKSLVHQPRLLLLDEPTAGVDIELRSSLWDFVRELRDDGMSILLTTHYLEEAEEMCDRVGIIHLGKMLATGPTSELIQNLTCRKVLMELRQAMGTITHPYLSSARGTELHFDVPSKVGIGDLLAELKIDLHQIKDLRIQEGSLEEAFLNVIGENGCHEE